MTYEDWAEPYREKEDAERELQQETTDFWADIFEELNQPQCRKCCNWAATIIVNGTLRPGHCRPRAVAGLDPYTPDSKAKSCPFYCEEF